MSEKKSGYAKKTVAASIEAAKPQDKKELAASQGRPIDPNKI